MGKKRNAKIAAIVCMNCLWDDHKDGLCKKCKKNYGYVVCSVIGIILLGIFIL